MGIEQLKHKNYKEFPFEAIKIVWADRFELINSLLLIMCCNLNC